MSQEHEERAAACRDGKSESDCPYPSDNGFSVKRLRWFNGFLETQIGMRLGKAFKRLGITWP